MRVNKEKLWNIFSLLKKKMQAIWLNGGFGVATCVQFRFRQHRIGLLMLMMHLALAGLSSKFQLYYRSNQS